MPTTSNFGWTTPADTDLVKDGAAAIRTLGNGIDTSLVDLKGGTTGQILSKASNTDLDYTWITNDVGDITEVQAGTGISVASGTGPIPVVTNTMATAINAAGDLIYGTANDTFTRLGIGTAGQVLQVNSGATAPEWVAPNGPAFRAFRSSTSQSFTQNVFTKVQFNGEDFDTASCFDSSTNYRFTPNKAGYYQVQATIEFSGSADTLSQVQLYKNGAAYSNLLYNTKLPASIIAGGSDIVALNGTTDYIEIFGKNSSATPSFAPGSTNTYFSACWLRSL